MVLVAAVLYGIVPGIVKVGGWFELLFVNGLGMPFNTGVVVSIIPVSYTHLDVYKRQQKQQKQPKNN